MQLDTVFQKTEMGQAEVQKRLLGLSQRERNLLILIDGQRPLSQVLNVSSDLVMALSQIQSLIDRQLIEIASNPSGQTPLVSATGPLSAEAFLRRKMKASKALQNVLGPDADRLCLLLEACKTEEEFESRFEKTVEVVRQLRTPATAAGFKEVASGI
jgi:type IV secretory pathway VirJ component